MDLKLSPTYLVVEIIQLSSLTIEFILLGKDTLVNWYTYRWTRMNDMI